MLATHALGRAEELLRERKLPLGLRLWSGESVMPPERPRVTITLRSPRVLSSLVNSTMGNLARHYVEQELDIDGDLREVMRLCETLTSGPIVKRTRFRLGTWLHSRLVDRNAIRFHYDVGNDFFGLWLDRRRVYSCAYFRSANDSLDLAQEQKLDHICRKLQLKPGERFLDVGCGWGALVMWAARHYKVRATGITLSESQYDHARKCIEDAGLQAVCDIQLIDYRDVQETRPYDKIASVGMFEHVGRKNLTAYFGKLFRLLRPGGLVLNHGIAAGAVNQVELGRGIGDFVQDYVFPDGELVHISKVIEEVSRSGLECCDLENLRPHYLKTLWHWVDRLGAKREAAVAAVGEKACRIWTIYMAGSAHAFERGWISVFQMLATRPPENGAWALPLTRDFMYSGESTSTSECREENGAA